MDMTPVISTNIAAVGYSELEQLLWVQFKNGVTYQYSNVPPDVHAKLMSGDTGRYFAEIIKPQRYTMPFVKLGYLPPARSGAGPDSDSSTGDMNQED